MDTNVPTPHLPLRDFLPGIAAGWSAERIEVRVAHLGTE